MEYIRTKEYETTIDVYFDGEKYVFINRFIGLVAVARRKGMPAISNDGNTAYSTFTVEYADGINKETVIKVIQKQESQYLPCSVAYEWKEEQKYSYLPYSVSVKLERMG